MAKQATVSAPTTGFQTEIPEGQWKFTQTGVDPVATTIVAYSDSPSYVFTGLQPGVYDFSVVRVSFDKTQEIGAKFTIRKTIKPDVIVQVANGIDVVITSMPGGS